MTGFAISAGKSYEAVGNISSMLPSMVKHLERSFSFHAAATFEALETRTVSSVQDAASKYELGSMSNGYRTERALMG